MLSNSQPPKAAPRKLLWEQRTAKRNSRAENCLEESWQAQVEALRATAAITWQRGWRRPVTPNIPCWVLREHRHSHCEEAEHFRCQNTIASYSHATNQHKTQAQPRISPIHKQWNLRKLKGTALFSLFLILFQNSLFQVFLHNEKHLAHF